MRKFALVISSVVLAYILDVAYFRGKYVDATFQMALNITHQLLGREQSGPRE
jgi:hypothetical protein